MLFEKILQLSRQKVIHTNNFNVYEIGKVCKIFIHLLIQVDDEVEFVSLVFGSDK